MSKHSRTSTLSRLNAKCETARPWTPRPVTDSDYWQAYIERHLRISDVYERAQAEFMKTMFPNPENHSF